MIENNIISDHFTVEELKKLKITPPDAKMYKKIRSNWDSVAKPLDGMGDFELLTAKIGAVLGDENIDISKKAVIMMCADNGVVAGRLRGELSASEGLNLSPSKRRP